MHGLITEAKENISNNELKNIFSFIDNSGGNDRNDLGNNGPVLVRVVDPTVLGGSNRQAGGDNTGNTSDSGNSGNNGRK